MRHTRPGQGRSPAALAAFLRAWGAGLVLGLAAFLIGFAFGVIRVVLVAPSIGALAAVGVELILFLPLLALVSAKVCRAFSVDTYGARYMAGLTALALLLVLEPALRSMSSGKLARPICVVLARPKGCWAWRARPVWPGCRP